MKMFVIYDKVAEEGSQPFCCKNDMVAERMFVQALKKSPADLSDLELYCVADFELDTLTFKNTDKVLVVTGQNIKDKLEKEAAQRMKEVVRK